MSIVKTEWGKLSDGRSVSLFTLDNGQGVTARISDYGGVIQSLRTPDRNGKPGEIGLGFEQLEQYIAKRKYYGALVGRVANRIRAGRFTLDGREHQLWVAPNGIHLHGGQVGFNSKLWTSSIENDKVRLDYLSPDGEEHYPGNLKVSVWYSLVGQDLILEYEATTDKPTIVNLTNHIFFNLNCCERDVLAHEIRIQADAYTPIDSGLVPTGEILPVAGTPLDFTTAKAIGRDLQDIPAGYDHNFIFNKTDGITYETLVDVYDPDTGRTLAMATSEPCTQFYTGNFLNGSDVGIDGKAFRHRYGFCLEAQKHPDAINHPNFANVVLRVGETYRQMTVYRFGTR